MFELVRQGFGISAKKKTVSIMILDKSSSMQIFGFAPVEAVNNHLRGLQESHDDISRLFALVTFSDESRVEIALDLVEKICTYEDYRPQGNTLLWETVHNVLDECLKRFNECPSDIRINSKIVIGVISDGQDNKSDNSRFPETLQKKARKAIDCGWELLTFGLGIRADKLAFEMGFSPDAKHAFTLKAEAQSLRQTSLHMTQTTHGCWKEKK